MNTEIHESIWLKNVNTYNTDIDMITISKTIESFSNDLERIKAKNLDLSCISRVSPSAQHLVAILRISYRFRKDIKGWFELCEFTRAYVDSFGFQSDVVMKGLLN